MSSFRWLSPVGLAVITGLAAFAVLSLLAAVERRGLTWWDPLMVMGASLAAYVVARAAARR